MKTNSITGQLSFKTNQKHTWHVYNPDMKVLNAAQKFREDLNNNKNNINSSRIYGHHFPSGNSVQNNHTGNSGQLTSTQLGVTP